MRQYFTLILVFVLVSSLLGAPAFAAFDLRGSMKIDLGEKPLDTAISQDGRWTFVLTEGGVIRVLSWRGEQTQVIETGENYRRLVFSAVGNRLILSGGDSDNVLVISLDMVHNLDTTGSPSKGSKDAPVVVAFFSDYQ